MVRAPPPALFAAFGGQEARPTGAISPVMRARASWGLLSGHRDAVTSNPPGDILEASLEQSVKASSTVPTRVRARITRGRFKGAFVLGMATFDRELKRILFAFERLRLPANDATYALKATGLAPSGQVGLEGDHHTQEGPYFAGEIVAAAAAGFADATTQRTQTALGTYQTEPTLANAGKQGAVQALSKTAERFAERSRTAPEYTEIEAGREIQIIVEQSPTEASGA